MVRSRRVGASIAVAAGLCAAGSAIVNLTALLRGKPLPGVAVLLIVAVPTLAVGQLWMIFGMQARMPRRQRGRSGVVPTRMTVATGRAIFFGELPARYGNALLALAFLGWLSAITAFPAISGGGPAGADAECRYRLSNHGSYTCVSRSTYEHTGAGTQRFASGVLLAFFALHAGAALGGSYRRTNS